MYKTSTNIGKNHAMIVLEDLKVRNFSKSAKATGDNRCENVKVKSGLNKSILDQDRVNVSTNARIKTTMVWW